MAELYNATSVPRLATEIGFSQDIRGRYQFLLMNGVLPAVRNRENGQAFVLAWADLVNLAIRYGIEEPMTVDRKEIAI